MAKSKKSPKPKQARSASSVLTRLVLNAPDRVKEEVHAYVRGVLSTRHFDQGQFNADVAALTADEKKFVAAFVTANYPQV